MQQLIRVGNSLLMRMKTRALYCVSLATVWKGRYRAKLNSPDYFGIVGSIMWAQN